MELWFIINVVSELDFQVKYFKHSEKYNRHLSNHQVLHKL